MSSNQIMFSCTTLKGTGKQGILKPDANGYWDVPLGALNVFNSAQEYYPYEECKQLFQKSSLLMRRIEKGVVRGELGHPKRLPGQSMQQYIHRCASIYEQMWCFHIASVWLDHESMKDQYGKPIIGIMGKCKGVGPYKSTFDESMDNKMENTCFSVRSFTDDYVSGGMVKKVVKEVVCWDLVNEPGISVATKYNAPTLEDYSTVIQKSEMDRVFTGNGAGIGLESAAIDFPTLYQTLGWTNPGAHKPYAASWK